MDTVNDPTAALHLAAAARATAAWWAEQITNPAPTNLGDPADAAMIVGEALADIIRTNQPAPTPEQLEVFIDQLTACIAADLAAQGFATVVVEWHPDTDPALRVSARYAGISPDLFPLKTSTRTTLKQATGTRGQGTLAVTLWTAPATDET